MRIFDSEPFMDKDGWFVGSFEPTVYKTDQFEVSYKLHHKLSTEINFLMKGKMLINETLI